MPRPSQPRKQRAFPIQTAPPALGDMYNAGNGHTHTLLGGLLVQELVDGGWRGGPDRLQPPRCAASASIHARYMPETITRKVVCHGVRMSVWDDGKLGDRLLGTGMGDTPRERSDPAGQVSNHSNRNEITLSLLWTINVHKRIGVRDGTFGTDCGRPSSCVSDRSRGSILRATLRL